jgi:hypothetical protein
MFGAVRGLFGDYYAPTPNLQSEPGSSGTSDTQDVFQPLDNASPESTPPREAAGPSSAASGSTSNVSGASGGRSVRGGGVRGGGGGGGGGRGPRDSDATYDPLLDDDGTDTGAGPRRRRPLAQRADVAVIEGARQIETMADAVEHVTLAMQRQIEKGRSDGFKPNEILSGDAAARTTFYTLLSDRQQRNVFLKVSGDMRNWPRLRGLFGAPPYNFLRSEDGQMLRAAGIAAGRSSMSYDDAQAAANYAQFGTGQLVDTLEREYRVIPPDAAQSTDPVPWLFDTATLGVDIVMQVRVKKRDKKRKLAMLRESVDARKTLTFPAPNDRILLTQTTALLSIQRRREAPDPITLQVRRVIPRGENAATAALIVRLA